MQIQNNFKKFIKIVIKKSFKVFYIIEKRCSNA
jgi:hypothetical protein